MQHIFDDQQTRQQQQCHRLTWMYFAREVVSIVRLSGSLLASLQLDGDATLDLGHHKGKKQAVVTSRNHGILG